MRNKMVEGRSGIIAGGDVTFGDISGQTIIGENIETQTLSIHDKKELINILIEFKREIAKSGLPEHDLSIFNDYINNAIKEIKTDKINTSKIKSRFDNAIEIIKDAGLIEKLTNSETIKKIITIFGKLGISILF